MSIDKKVAEYEFEKFWGRLFAEKPPERAWEWFWPMLIAIGVKIRDPEKRGIPEGYDATCEGCNTPFVFQNSKLSALDWEHYCCQTCEKED